MCCSPCSGLGQIVYIVLHLLLKELNPGTSSVILTQGSSKYNFPDNLSTGYFTNNPNLRISYASQESWLFSGTVRDNILFGQSSMIKLDTCRYFSWSKVIVADIEQCLYILFCYCTLESEIFIRD